MPHATFLASLARASLVLVAVALSVAHPAAAQEKERVNPNAKALAEFQEEVKDYVELHRKLEATLLDVPREATPQQLDQRERALATLIQNARKGKRQGEIFERETRPVLRKLLYGIFTGPDGQRMRRAIFEENPGDAVKLQVNGRYPDTIPFSTVPPQVLRILPPMPPELEYRFIGSTLILLDAHAHIIVDYMTGAVPR